MQLSKRPSSAAWISCAKGAIVTLFASPRLDVFVSIIQSASSNSVTADELSECHKKAIETNSATAKKTSELLETFHMPFSCLIDECTPKTNQNIYM